MLMAASGGNCDRGIGSSSSSSPFSSAGEYTGDSGATSVGGGAGGVAGVFFPSESSRVGTGIFFMVRGSSGFGSGCKTWEDSGCACSSIARGETGVLPKTMAPSGGSQAFRFPFVPARMPSRIYSPMGFCGLTGVGATGSWIRRALLCW